MLPFDNVILRLAIIRTIQNVRLQRRHRPTDDASTRRWRGSQHTGLVRTTRRSDARAAGHRLRNKYINACPALYIFLVSAMQKLLKLVKI